MPISRTRLAFTATLMLSLIGAAAASAEPLSLDQAIQRAVGRHPAIAAAESASEAATEGVAQLESAWYPRVNLNAYYRYVWPVAELNTNTGITPPGATEPVVFSQQIGTANNAGISLEAGWRALDWGYRNTAVEAAEASARALREDESVREVDIAYAVRVAYLTSVFFAEVVTITQRSLDSAQQVLDDRQAKLDAGLGNELEVASASARVAELDSRMVDVQSQQALAETTLRILLGMEESEPLELTDGLDAVDAGAAASDTLENPSIRRLDEMAESYSLQADAVQRSFWPTLDVFANLAYQYPWTMVDTDTAGFAVTTGVSLSWQLFDGFQRSHREDELRSRVDATVHAREAGEEELTRNQRDAMARRRAADAQLDAAQRQLEAADTYVRVAQAAYSSGAGTALDVIAANDSADIARIAEARARFSAAVARADLLKAAGVSTSPETSSDRPNTTQQ